MLWGDLRGLGFRQRLHFYGMLLDYFQRRPYLNLWRARIMWTGLAPIYAKASLSAIISGPHRKPVYRVTRKEDDQRWHWQQSMPQALPIMVVAIVAIYAVVNQTLPSLVLLSASMYWGALNVALLVGFVSRSWHGLQSVTRVTVQLRRWVLRTGSA